MEEVRDVLMVRNIARRANRRQNVRYNAFNDLNDIEFKKRYRLSKNAVHFVIGLVADELSSNAGHAADISPSLQILVALRYYAKGSFQIEIGIVYI